MRALSRVSIVSALSVRCSHERNEFDALRVSARHLLGSKDNSSRAEACLAQDILRMRMPHPLVSQCGNEEVLTASASAARATEIASADLSHMESPEEDEKQLERIRGMATALFSSIPQPADARRAALEREMKERQKEDAIFEALKDQVRERYNREKTLEKLEKARVKNLMVARGGDSYPLKEDIKPPVGADERWWRGVCSEESISKNTAKEIEEREKIEMKETIKKLKERIKTLEKEKNEKNE